MKKIARDAANDTQRALLERVGSDISDEDVAAIQQTMIDTGAVTQIETEIDELLSAALTAIDALPDRNGSQAALRALADFVASRDA